MRIVHCINAEISEVESSQHNIFIGLSLGNKYFLVDEQVRCFVQWALEHSRVTPIILIPDAIQAVNYQVRNGYTKARAERLAYRKGSEMVTRAQRAIDSCSPNVPPSIIRWADVEQDGAYQREKRVLYEAFESHADFQDCVQNIVKESVGYQRLFTDAQWKMLCRYPLDELPIMIRGLSYQGVLYDAIPYPGFSALDALTQEIQDGQRFPSLTDALQIKQKAVIIEAYA